MSTASGSTSIRRVRAGFTLVDLLVVVAVLAILAAMLLPVLYQTKEKARQAQCISNLRQFGAAFEMYAQDWSEWWPSPGGRFGDYAYWSQTGRGGLEDYIRQRGVGSTWCCPHIKQWNGRFAARSYSMNSYLRRPCDIEYPMCVTILCGASVPFIEEPSRTILLFEGLHLTLGWEDALDYVYRCGNWSCVKGYYPGIVHTVDSGAPWHGAVSNFLYCDGHVKSRVPGKRKGRTMLSDWDEMYEWYVSKAYFIRIRPK